MIVENGLKLDPFNNVLFVFCNKQMNKLKILHFDEAEKNSDPKAAEPILEEITYVRNKNIKIVGKKVSAGTNPVM